MDGLKVNVIKKEDCEVVLGVEIPEEKVSREMESTFQDLQQRASLPGFRKGKVPIHVIRSNFQSRCREEVLQKLIPDALEQALKEQNLQPLTPAKIDDLSFKENSPITFKTIIEIRPKIKLGKYKKLKLTDTRKKTTDAMVEEAVDHLRNQRAQLIVSDRDTVREDDFVLLDYQGSIDGEPLKGLTRQNQLINLSFKEDLPGFREGIIGSKKGQEKELRLHFPKEYPLKEAQDKDVILKIKVKEIKEKQLPELDDAFSKEFGKESVAELKGEVRKNLEKAEEDRAQKSMKQEIVDKLTEESSFTLPATLVEQQLQSILSELKKQVKQRDPSRDLAQEEEKWKTEYHPLAEKQVKIGFVLDEIARLENVTVTDEELKDEINRLKAVASRSGLKDRDLDEYFKNRRDRIYHNMLDEKIFNFIIENAKIKR